MGGDYKTVDRKDMGRVIEQSVEKSTAVAVSLFAVFEIPERSMSMPQLYTSPPWLGPLFLAEL